MDREQFNEEQRGASEGAAEFRRAQTDGSLAVPPPPGRDAPSLGEEPGPRRRSAAKLKATAKQVEDHVAELTEMNERIEAIEARARRAEARAAAAQQRAEEAVRMEAELRAELAQSRQVLQARTKRSDERLREAEEALLGFPKLAGEVEERVKSIEQRVAEADDVVRELSIPGGEAVLATASAEPETGDDERYSGLFDINRISFEQLRELGLSVTQAARLLASRDARGRFHSLDEINDLWGFSREIVDQLKRRLRLA